MNLKSYKHKFNIKNETMSLESYLDLCTTDSSVYSSPFERMLKVIGEPEIIDTAKDARLGRIFSNRVIKRYKVFKDFYGMEDVIEKIVSFFTHAAQGLEERKQILYLLGPVGSAKSSLAECLKELMESEPFYALAVRGDKGVIQISPIFEDPLGLFTQKDSEALGIPSRYLTKIPSPWAVKRLKELGDVSKFLVVKLYPNQLEQIAISKTEPGDENNQDISALVGKLDIRQLEYYSQDDPDAYKFSGGLCLGNRGILEFVEMFKAPIKVLHPLLTATQEGNYKGTEALSAIPFEGIILAHSNESEWQSFRDNKNNEAFLDRIYIVKVPYCLRLKEEKQIYDKLIVNSSLAKTPCAPHTLEMLSKFSVLTRLDVPQNSSIYVKVKVYDGQSLKNSEPHAKSFYEYKETASAKEGFEGLSTRSAFKILSQVYNYDIEEVAADPVHMLLVLKKYIASSDLNDAKKELWIKFLDEELETEYFEIVRKDIQTAYLDSCHELGQYLFDRYIVYADYWIQDADYRDHDTGHLYDKAALNDELEKIEKPGKISNPKDFRHEIVNFALRYRAQNKGKNVSWTSYEKLREVIEHNLFKDLDKILPQISFEKFATTEENKKQQNYVARMKEKGYTERQVKRITEWCQRNMKGK